MASDKLVIPYLERRLVNARKRIQEIRIYSAEHKIKFTPALKEEIDLLEFIIKEFENSKTA